MIIGILCYGIITAYDFIELCNGIFKIVENNPLLHQLSNGMLKFSQPFATQKIVESIQNHLNK